MTLPSVKALEPVALRAFRDARGVLVPLELAQAVPFPVRRVFWITDVPAGTERGGHAHKTCHQYLVCIGGLIQVGVDDGTATRTLPLPAGSALHVPPGIYATEHYLEPGSVLIVFCDRPYESADYLTDRAPFIMWRRSTGG